MEPAPRLRRRPAVSCILCRKRKIKCDRETPCGNCTKSGNVTCAYRDAPSRPRKLGIPRAAASSTATAVPPLTPSSTILAPTVPTDSRTLPAEPWLSAAPSTAQSPASTMTRNSRVETKTVCLSRTVYFHAEHRSADQPGAIIRSITHKTRLFGQSHWANVMTNLYEIFEVMESHKETSKAFVTEKRCKTLSKYIKSRRAPPWPCPPTPELPRKDIADALVERYLQTHEAIYRVLHIPTFRRDYAAVWDPGGNVDPSFLVQLKLVLAIGAATYDSTFTLRTSAVRWVYEAQTWLSAPEFKHHLNIPTLQTSLLLLLARDATGIGEDMVWASLGSTLRMAIYMGLHRDPASLGPRTITPLTAELRRRLWNTILEMAVHSSLNSGGPPLVGLADFDTDPPGNFDDEQLEVTDEPVAAKPPDHFTQTTVAIALRVTLPQRLAIAKYLNDLSSCGTYPETLRLDADLRTAYKTLSRILQTCKTTAAPSGTGLSPSAFQFRMLELLLQRYFMALHVPFFALSLSDATFAFSRKVTVDSALKLWRAVFPSPLDPSSCYPSPEDENDMLCRMAVSGSGFFRTVAVQACVAIAIELKTQLREEEGSLGSVHKVLLGSAGALTCRPDLSGVLHEFKVWSWKAILAGETNVKGYLVACMIDAQVEGLRKGLRDGEIARLILEAAEKAVEEGAAFLEGVVDTLGMEQGGDGVGGVVLPELGLEDWDYMDTEGLQFASSVPEHFGWVFQ